jgi:hypothetical protein
MFEYILTQLQVLAILSSGLLASVPLQTQKPLSATIIGQILPLPSPPAKSLSAVARRRPGKESTNELWVVSAGKLLKTTTSTTTTIIIIIIIAATIS